MVTVKQPIFIKYADSAVADIKDAQGKRVYPDSKTLSLDVDTSKALSIELTGSALGLYKKTETLEGTSYPCYMRITVRDMAGNILPISKDASGKISIALVPKSKVGELEQGGILPAIAVVVRYAKPRLVYYMAKNKNGTHVYMGDKYVCYKIETSEPYSKHTLASDNDVERYFGMKGAQVIAESATETNVYLRKVNVMVGATLKEGKSKTEVATSSSSGGSSSSSGENPPQE